MSEILSPKEFTDLFGDKIQVEGFLDYDLDDVGLDGDTAPVINIDFFDDEDFVPMFLGLDEAKRFVNHLHAVITVLVNEDYR